MREGCQPLLVILTGLEHKTSPTPFFSSQDLQIDQVTACSHFWGAVFSSPLCVILFAVPLSAFWSLLGVGGVESVLPPFKSFSGWQSSTKPHQLVPIREQGGEKEVIFLILNRCQLQKGNQRKNLILPQLGRGNFAKRKKKKNPGLCFPPQWTVLVLVLREAVSKVQWCSCGQSGDVQHVQGRNIWSLLHEGLCKFSVKPVAGSLWSSVLEQTFVGRKQRQLSDWFMHLYKYCCLLKSETAQGFLTAGNRKGAVPFRGQVVRIDPRLSQHSGKNFTDMMLQLYWPH